MFFAKLKRKKFEKEIDKKIFSKLSHLFVSNPEKAIAKANKYFLQWKKVTYDQFIDEVKSTQKSTFCNTAWSQPSLCGQCYDCQITNNTCFCIPCFLAGHHEQHNSTLYYTSSGNCDCGNPAFIKPSGYCPHHPGPDLNPDITQMTPENRQKFNTVFKSAFYGAMNYTSKQNMIKCLEYISQFIKYGDGLRRCASYAIVSVSEENFFGNMLKMNQEMVDALIDLFGQLIADLYFLQKMSFLYYQNFHLLQSKMQKYICKNIFEDSYEAIKKLYSFQYHFFCKGSISYAIQKKNFNWPVFLSTCICNSLNCIAQSRFNYDTNFDGKTIQSILDFKRFLGNILEFDDQHDNIQDFIDRYSTSLLNFEGIMSYNVQTTPQDESDIGYCLYQLGQFVGDLHLLFTEKNKRASPKNRVFSVSKVVANLASFFENKDVRPYSILDSMKKIKISTFIPLHHLLFCLLQNYKDPKSVIEDECKKLGISFQYFCSVISIFPLRAVASTCFLSGKFLKVNRGFLYALKHTVNEPTYNFNCLFGLFQTLLGIAPEKEKMIENILETFGVFENEQKYKEELDNIEFDRQMFLIRNTFFEASVFILSLLTDKSITSGDQIYFSRLQTIELLKMKKRATAKDIEEYTEQKFGNAIFSDEMQEYIERVTNKSGESFFKLKSEGDFTPFFPPIISNDRMDLFMKCTGNNLIPVLDYSELPREISLTCCFRLPAFIALTFKLLSLTETDITTKKVGFAMFISLVRNGPKFDDESFKQPNPISIKARDLKELVSELVKVSDQLDKINILTISIQFEEMDPTTIIKLVQSNKELAKAAIEKAELPEFLVPQDEKAISDLIKEKKAKAALLKERLMRDYMNRRKQFGAVETTQPQKVSETASDEKVENDNDNNDDDEGEGDVIGSGFDDNDDEKVCSVCLSKQDDILGFPCLSLPSTLPSIIENKLHNKTGSSPTEETFTMNICSHIIHYKCYIQLRKDEENRDSDSYSDSDSDSDKKSPIKELFHCMMDRGNRNCFLPLFETSSDAFTTNPSVMTRIAITDFIRRAFNETVSSEIFVAFKSFAGMITKLEVRHRSHPESLDSREIPALLRNLLLTLYHGLHKRAAKAEEGANSDNPLVDLVFQLVKSESPVESFESIVKDISSRLEDSLCLYEFLRRAAIVEEFALKDEAAALKGKFVDWDDVLSFGSLTARYSISGKSDNEIELPLFEGIHLPENFINLCMPPYNMEIFDSSVLRAVDLLTGKVVVLLYSKKSDDRFQKINSYVEENYGGGLALFLCLSGEKASGVFFYSSLLNKEWEQSGIYVDQFGDVNLGFSREIRTALSQDRLESALNNLLSGQAALY